MAPLCLDQVVLTGEFVHEVLQARKCNTSRGKKDVDSVLGAVRWLSICAGSLRMSTKSFRPDHRHFKAQGREDGQHGRLQDIPETLTAWAARYIATLTAPEDGS